MKRQIIGIVVAIVLAVLGTLALVSYVRSAKDDAVKNQQPVDVYVVSHDIGKGTAVSDMTNLVKLTSVPERLVAADAVRDLGELDQTLVAGIDLAPGDQLRSARLVDGRTLVRVVVPKGLQEITVALSPERAVGGALLAGDTVGVVFSFDPFDLASAGSPATDTTDTTALALPRTPNTTHLTLHKVLVTAVQFSAKDRSAISGEGTETTVGATVAQAPGDQLLVTLAVTAAEAEQVVFAAEFGDVWLTAEPDDATEDGTRILTLSGVYVTVVRK